MSRYRQPRRSIDTRALAVGLAILAVIAVVGGLLAPRFNMQGTLLAMNAYANEPAGHAAEPSEPMDAVHAPQPEDGATTDSEVFDGDQMIFAKDPTETMVQSIKEREKKLDERERKLAEEERRLQDLKREVEAKLAASEKVLKDMRALAGQADAEREKELGKWLKIYQAMPPAQAGQVIAGLDPEFARLLLARMDSKKAAKILATFPPDKAVELGKRLEQDKQKSSNL